MLDQLAGTDAQLILHVFIEESSGGAGRTGLAYNTANLVVTLAVVGTAGGYMTLETVATLGEYEEPSSASHARFRELSSSVMPGVYEIHLPSSYFATSQPGFATLHLRGASNMKTKIVQIQKMAPVAAEGLTAFGIPVLSATATTLTVPQLDLPGADDSLAGAILVVRAQNGDHPQQTALVTSSVSDSDEETTVFGIVTAKANGQWWRTPDPLDVFDLRLTANPVLRTVDQITTAINTDADPLASAVPGTYAAGTAGAALARLAGASVQTSSPVSQSGEVLRLLKGDSYLTADNRQLDFTKGAGANWPTNISAWTPTLTIACPGGPLAKTGSVVTATGDGQKVRFELTAAETAAMPIGSCNFTVKIASSPSNITLIVGEAVVDKAIA